MTPPADADKTGEGPATSEGRYVRLCGQELEKMGTSQEAEEFAAKVNAILFANRTITLESRKGFCMFCGKCFEMKSEDEESVKAVYEQAMAHDRVCDSNPLVKELAESRSRAARMEDYLKTYGRHFIGCESEGEQMCDCGFEDAMKDSLSPKDGR